jgi:hypothetical protein
MIGPDNSINGGLIGALTIFGLNGLVARRTYSNRRLEPTVLACTTATSTTRRCGGSW